MKLERNIYCKKIFYASNVNNNNNNNNKNSIMEIQIYKRVYAGSSVKRFL